MGLSICIRHQIWIQTRVGQSETFSWLIPRICMEISKSVLKYWVFHQVLDGKLELLKIETFVMMGHDVARLCTA